MTDKLIVFFDVEEAYVHNIINYIKIKQSSSIKLQAFTEKELLNKFCQNNKIDILIVSSSVMDQVISLLPVKKVIILSEGEILAVYKDIPVINKYQSANNIFREIMAYCIEIDQSGEIYTTIKKDVSVIGIYSPVKRCGKSIFSITLAQIYGKKFNTLYINLEEYSGILNVLGEESAGDLSDLIFFYKNHSTDIKEKYYRIISKLEDMYYIPPVMFSEDLKNIESHEWKGFLQKLIKETEFNKIIIDIGEMVKDVADVLSYCNIIYMPILEDELSKLKILEYKAMLNCLGKQEILEKTKELLLPKQEDRVVDSHYISGLVWGDIGDYIRKMN